MNLSGNSIFRGFSFQTWLIFFIFFIIYGLISFTNHYIFRTFAWDLGINCNAMYDYSHFRVNDCMLLPTPFDNLLSDHFSLLIIPVSFFRYLFGTYTLLVFQIFMLLVGGLGVYRFVAHQFPNTKLPELSIICFFSFWGIYSALSFDYHDNVAGAMFIPWFFYYLDTNKFIKASVMLLLTMISKENMALFCTFICLGSIFIYRDRKRMIYATSMAVFSLVYFYVVISYVMPSLANDGKEYLHFNFKALGDNFSDAISNILQNPLMPFKLLFVNNIGSTELDEIKIELLLYLVSAGWLLLLKPQFAIMLIPIMAQKLFNDDIGKWGINYHYNIEFAPILVVGSFMALKFFKNVKARYIIALILVTIYISSTAISLDHRKSIYYNPEYHIFYSKEHYIRNFNVGKVYDALKIIPENANVSAQSSLVPHLAFRDYIYQFPIIQNSEYVILNTEDTKYPISDESFAHEIDKLKSDQGWKLIHEDPPMLIFRKK